MHFVDAAKYVTMTNQPSIFLIVEVNKKWYESLPKDLQSIIDKDGAAQSAAIAPTAASFRAKAEQSYAASGGEEIKLAPDEQATLLRILSSVGADVSKASTQLAEGYKIVTDAAARAAAAPSQ
jgi:TRAP-type C4-dicarboxylate transport system substrate-binding protein